MENMNVFYCDVYVFCKVQFFANAYLSAYHDVRVMLSCRDA